LQSALRQHTADDHISRHEQRDRRKIGGLKGLAAKTGRQRKSTNGRQNRQASERIDPRAVSAVRSRLAPRGLFRQSSYRTAVQLIESAVFVAHPDRLIDRCRRRLATLLERVGGRVTGRTWQPARGPPNKDLCASRHLNGARTRSRQVP
jgi:hypothetical protein